MTKQAQHHPVNKPATEVSTADMEVGQRPPVDLTKPRSSESIAPLELDAVTGDLDHQRLEALAFMEEPMTIVLQKGAEKFAPNMVDCWVDGRGVEQFINGKWVSLGWLPVNVPVTTRRKYVEVLARAKQDAVKTEVVKHKEEEDNLAHRFTSGKYPLSVVRDDNPRGYAWLTRVLMEA